MTADGMRVHVRVGALVAALACGLTASGCTDGAGVSDAPRAVPLELVPSFQVEPSPFTSSPIDRIRLRAFLVGSGASVGVRDVAVDPSALEWVLSLAVDMGSEPIDVIVEVELLSGGVVEWSGRVGPITVTRSGRAPPAQPVEVFRGPLDNLDVASVLISDPPSQLMAGTTATVGAAVTLAQGSTAQPTVYWATGSSAVATVTPTGTAATVTAVAAGTVDVFAGAGSATDQFTLEVLPRVESVVVTPATASIDGAGTTAQFSAAVTDGFGNPDPNAPVTWSSTNTSVATVDPSSGLATGVGPGTTSIQATSFGITGTASLTVSGAPAADATWVGGDATAPSDWGTASNWSPTQVPQSSTSVLIPAASSLPVLDADRAVGSLAVASGAVVDLGAHTLQIGGDLDATGGVYNGTTTMVGGGSLGGVVDDLIVDGPSVISGALTAGGSLVVQDALTVGAGSVAVGGGLTVSGASGRLVMNDPDGIVQVYSGAEFLNVDEQGALNAGVFVTTGNLTVFGSTAYTPAATHRTLFAGTAGQTVYFDTPGPSSGRIGRMEVLPGAIVDLVSDVHVLDDVVLTGNLTVSAAYALSIDGQLLLDSGGTLNVNGVVTATGGCVENGGTVTGSGSHPCSVPEFSRTWLGGDVAAPTDWHTAANWSPAGVPTSADDVLVNVTSGAPVLGQNASVGSIAVRGGASVGLNGFTLTVAGDLEATQAILGGTVVVSGPGSVLEGTVEGLRLDAARTLSGALFVGESLTLTAGVFDPAGQSVSIGGDLVVQGSGVLAMTTVGGSVVVSGNADFGGGSHVGQLTQGTLAVGGSFTVSSSAADAFVATSAHTVVFAGAGTQVVDFANPDVAAQRFQNVFFQSGVSAAFASEVVATGAFTVVDGAFVTATDQTVSIGGSYTDVGAGLSAAQIVVIGNLTAFPAAVTTNVVVAAPWTLPGSVSINGSMTVDAPLTVGGSTLSLTQGFTVIGGGRLIMQTPNAVVDIAGSAAFDGADSSGSLTDGLVRVAGDFTVGSANSSTAFVAGGNHTVVLDGTVDQTVSFSNPSPTGQRFANFTDENFSGAIRLTSTMVVTGVFFTDDVTLARAGAGAVVDVRGIASVNATTFIGLPLRVTSTSLPATHTFSLVTFQAMDPADVQLYLALPGAGRNAPLVATSMFFDTPNFTVGAHVETARSALADLFLLQFSNSLPSPLTVIQGPNTVIEQF